MVKLLTRGNPRFRHSSDGRCPAGIAADNSIIVAQFCVQVRKIAIRITMVAITTMETFVIVRNV